MANEHQSLNTEAIKQRQQATWATGDYAVVGTWLQLTGELLCEAVDVVAGWRVLDVAAGNGNAALAAARRGCAVTAVDYVPELLTRLEARSAAEALSIETLLGDAEALDHPDASFDAVLSTFGVMFTPDQEQAAAELLRVCRPGGRIGLVAWTPDSFVADMLRTIGRYVSQPPGLRSPLEWGREPRVRELLGSGITELSTTERQFVFRRASPQSFIEVMSTYYGPMVKAFETLQGSDRDGLLSDLVELTEQHNTASGSTLRLPSSYLEVVATRA
jgi:ubiquinone/menaquinone biosynthesis C-methylase UbiE